MKSPDSPEFDALVDAVVERLQGRFSAGTPIPIPKNPEGPQLPWDPLDEGPPEVLRRRRLRIAGMELTQSIQHHGAVGESFGPDNSVPLVALKTLVARVYSYVRPGLAWPDALTGSRVTGELVLSVGHHVVYRTGPTRSDGVHVGPSNELFRTLWDRELVAGSPGPGGFATGLVRLNCPLNFVVPAYYCRRGRMHVEVRIWRMIGAALPSAGDPGSVSEFVHFVDVPAPRVALVRVKWDNGSGTVTSPTDVEMLRTIRLAERMLPFPYFEATIPVLELTRSGAFFKTVTGGGCNEAWNELINKIEKFSIMTALWQPGQIMIGMVPRAALPGPRAREARSGTEEANTGCGRPTGVGGCFVDEAATFAHELGHIYDRRHVAVPGGGSKNDPGYPNYGGSKTSIGEVGIDTGASPPALFDPRTNGDIMSYEPSQWISPYTYRAILEARGKHQGAPADPRRVRPVLLLEVRVRRTERGLTGIQVKGAFRIEAPGFVPRNFDRATSPVSIDLLDSERRIVATHHCLYVQSQPSGSCGCGGQDVVPLEREPYIDLFEVIEWPGEHVTALSFHRGEAPLATFEVGEPPRVEIEGPERREDKLVLRVRAAHPRETPAVAVLFSGDDSITWQPIGFDPPDGELSVEAARLPGGERCRFRAIAGAELQSAVADTGPFELAPSARRVHLIAPDDKCGIPPGPVTLSALIDTRGRGAVAPHEIRWSSSLQGDIGAGYDVTTQLMEGEHAISVTVPDGIGDLLTERAIIIVGGRPPTDDLR